MFSGAKKLIVGIILLVLASSALLLSDLHHRKRTGPATVNGHLTRKWKVYLIQYNDVLDVKDSEEGVLKEGTDYEPKVLNAQGDMATVSALIDSATTGGADMIITFSTPTLQAAIRRGDKVPIVFTYVASAIAAGAGKSDTDHLPNVTGVALGAAYDEMMALLRRDFPKVRRVGTLFVPSETNSVYHRKLFEQAAEENGIQVVALPASTATEVPDAAVALASRDIDAIVQIPGNLTASAFTSIAYAAQRARMPVFAFQKQQALDGALVVLGRDYRDAGHAAGLMAARVMRGEDPARIPFAEYDKTHLIVNLKTARALGVTFSPELLKSAKEVIR